MNLYNYSSERLWITVLVSVLVMLVNLLPIVISQIRQGLSSNGCKLHRIEIRSIITITRSILASDIPKVLLPIICSGIIGYVVSYFEPYKSGSSLIFGVRPDYAWYLIIFILFPILFAVSLTCNSNYWFKGLIQILKGIYYGLLAYVLTCQSFYSFAEQDQAIVALWAMGLTLSIAIIECSLGIFEGIEKIKNKKR